MALCTKREDSLVQALASHAYAHSIDFIRMRPVCVIRAYDERFASILLALHALDIVIHNNDNNM